MKENHTLTNSNRVSQTPTWKYFQEFPPAAATQSVNLRSLGNGPMHHCTVVVSKEVIADHTFVRIRSQPATVPQKSHPITNRISNNKIEQTTEEFHSSEIGPIVLFLVPPALCGFSFVHDRHTESCSHTHTIYTAYFSSPIQPTQNSHQRSLVIFNFRFNSKNRNPAD